MTIEKALELIDFQKQQINNLAIERDKLKEESVNLSQGLISSNETNTLLNNLCDKLLNNFSILGINYWEINKLYKSNDKILYNGYLYKSLQEHISQEEYPPNTSKELWIKME